MDYSNFVKTNRQYKLLLEQFSAGKMNHVCLLKSPDSNFSKEIVLSLAAKIVDCPLAQVQKKIHPDNDLPG